MKYVDQLSSLLYIFILVITFTRGLMDRALCEQPDFTNIQTLSKFT